MLQNGKRLKYRVAGAMGRLYVQFRRVFNRYYKLRKYNIFYLFESLIITKNKLIFYFFYFFLKISFFFYIFKSFLNLFNNIKTFYIILRYNKYLKYYIFLLL